ncbi:alpha-1,2-fucosyltransferase [Alphaproteobacteria bacterium]|nr:alpha-1,2-fucosyltransferase [Alphaproteobacteria bacterium]
MIIFFENGRLGNQLFQYNGLKDYFPKHKLIFIGFASLQNSFSNIDVLFIRLKINSFSIRIFRKIFLFLSDIRILGKINEIDSKKSFHLKISKGILWNIFIAQNIYFQHKSYIDKIKNSPKLKKIYIDNAIKWLKEKNISFKYPNLVFVHFRRGDYLSWPNNEFPAVLDLSWYKQNISYMKKKIKNPIFIIMGDDICFLKNAFKESRNLIISDNSYIIDLCIMRLCSHGILSASSFAWWGAFYSKNLIKKKNYYIAPKFWAGHRSKKWIPKNFFTEWITYV